MKYKYVCRICGNEITGDKEDGVVLAAEQHYVNAHGLQHESDVEPTGIESDDEAIKKDVSKVED